MKEGFQVLGGMAIVGLAICLAMIFFPWFVAALEKSDCAASQWAHVSPIYPYACAPMPMCLDSDGRTVACRQK